MWGLFSVCAAILFLLVIAAGLYAAGLPGYQAVAFTVFGGTVASVLIVAIFLSIQDKTRHVD